MASALAKEETVWKNNIQSIPYLNLVQHRKYIV